YLKAPQSRRGAPPSGPPPSPRTGSAGARPATAALIAPCRRPSYDEGRGFRSPRGRTRALRGSPPGRAGQNRSGYTIGGSAPNSQEEIVTKILTPPQAAPILEIARELLPPGMELIVVDRGKPEF